MPVETEADRRSFFNTAEYGREATYTPPGGPARTIAILDDWQALDLLTDGVAGIEADSLKVSALADDVPDTSRDARLMLSGVTYKVARAHPDGTGFVVLTLVEA
ncbi:hypothetical protein [Pleomorphomonas sp. JP5]|uniref:head-tail joining protein n=1 Tax=Pleomorphomonas sp. JP5 TaxID=2942998 RepID=UPI0020437490|nr:hypothetical protein [Pleomorphomonas sp. JP5]MCM5560313.1 hypothetical protein [Pleomorphomonas sp. JP5]